MSCQLKFYDFKWEPAIRNFTLDKAQLSYVFLPCNVIEWAVQDEYCYPIVILYEQEPVGFFILQYSEETREFTENADVLFLRAFCIDRRYQGKGYGKSAMNCLPGFTAAYFPHISEIILTVNEHNLPAKRLYEKSAFQYIGKNKTGRSGIEQGMRLFINSKESLL